MDDTSSPLRGGTVGAWADFARAEWDNFRVREVEGFSSGISGDADGDGVCDVDFATGPRVVKKKNEIRLSPNIEADRLEHMCR